MGKKKRFARPSVSTIISICALVFALTGTAFAAGLIGSKQIKNNSVRGADIKNKTITGLDINGKTKKKLKGKQGATGETGATGQDGATGEQGPAGDGSVNVKSLTPDTTGDGVAPPAWGERNSAGCGSATGDTSVSGDTLSFDLPDAAGSDSASADFNGYNDVKLRDFSHISYSAKYDQTGTDQHGGTPYFTIYTENFDHKVIFSPNTQPNAQINSGEWQEFTPTEGTVRYDDDAGQNPDITWRQLIAQHGDDDVTQIRIQTGCGGAYTADTTANADNLEIVADGQSAVYDFGQ